MESFPKNHKEGEYFLYIYQHKRSYHIRVAQFLRDVEDNYWRSARRRAYNTAECAALGLDLAFLTRYHGLSAAYFHARMAVNQNRATPRLSELEGELIEPFREHIENVRKYRLKAARAEKHRAWSDLAILRKRARAVLPTEILPLVFPSTKGLYS
jgi:hypothetical protein